MSECVCVLVYITLGALGWSLVCDAGISRSNAFATGIHVTQN